MEGDRNHYAESWIWSTAPVNPCSAAGLGFCTDSFSKRCRLASTVFLLEGMACIKGMGYSKGHRDGMQKSCSCHYRLVGNTICCCVKVSYNFVGPVKKWSLEYKLLFFAVNQGLKIHSGSWFCSKLLGYILWIFGINSHEVYWAVSVLYSCEYEFCHRIHPVLACSWKQTWKQGLLRTLLFPKLFPIAEKTRTCYILLNTLYAISVCSCFCSSHMCFIWDSRLLFYRHFLHWNIRPRLSFLIEHFSQVKYKLGIFALASACFQDRQTPYFCLHC